MGSTGGMNSIAARLGGGAESTHAPASHEAAPRQFSDRNAGAAKGGGADSPGRARATRATRLAAGTASRCRASQHDPSRDTGSACAIRAIKAVGAACSRAQASRTAGAKQQHALKHCSAETHPHAWPAHGKSKEVGARCT
jgi:hypothetical protein